MRKIYTIFITLLLATTTWAQSPQKMSYQAVIRNSSDQLVTNHAVGMRISILQGSATGTSVYVETQTPTTNASGLATIEIGGGTFVTGSFSSIDWATGPYFIKTETDPTGGTSYTITGTSQLLSVPYAFYAKTAGTSVALQSQINMMKNSMVAGGVVTDYENNIYNVVKIGNQIWMSENLKTTKYNDGTGIPNITDNTAWAALTTGAYSDYDNTPANSTTFGRLYNWYAVDNNAATKVASNGGKNVCPTGWHVPTEVEWTTLENYLITNGYNWDGTTTGNKIGKSMASTSGWTTDPTAGNVGNDQASNNRSGFTALPVGGRFISSFMLNKILGFWWSVTERSSTRASQHFLENNLSNLGRYDDFKYLGFSVRCLRD
jgi:uncharacterized protein (TIGR02145 family)